MLKDAVFQHLFRFLPRADSAEEPARAARPILKPAAETDATAAPAPVQVASPRNVYLAVAGLCLAGALLVPWIGRVPEVIRATMAALALQALLCLGLAAADRFDRTRAVRMVRLFVLLLVAVLAAVPGYFFGPNSGFGSLIALILVLVGLLSGGGVPGWSTYLALALGQAGGFALVVCGVLPDHSLTRLLQPHPPWHWVAGHAAVQALFLSAYLAGRAFQRRYRKLAQQVDEAARAAARREALLDEARAEYKRALAAGLDGVFSGHRLGSYRLGRVLGRGGMGEVYEAAHVDGGTPAAVKLLRGDRLADAPAVERFLHETEIAARVDSPHIARVYEIGGLERAMPFLAMERIEGEDLATRLERGGRLAPAELRALVEDLTHALDAIHASGVVHLDINPRNLMQAQGGRWKLLDFGLAQLLAARAPDTGPVGALRYLAPERLRGSFADARADIYGLCACLYAAVTGKDPFREIPAGSLLHAVLDGTPVAPHLLAEVPEDVEHVLLIGLAKLAVDRFESARELREAFQSALEGRLEQRFRERALGLARTAPWSAAPTPEATTEVIGAETARTAILWDVFDAEPEPPPKARAAAAPRAPAARAESGPTSDPASTYAWQDAYHHKMRGFSMGVTALCLGGAVLLGLIVAHRDALYFAWACMAGIVAATWLAGRLTRRHTEASPYWPWALVGALSVGPAYALGFHSGFTSVMAVLLFSGGLYRAALGSAWINRREIVLLSTCLSQAALFGLVLAGVVPDHGNARVLEPGLSVGVSLLQHILQQGVYVASFILGRLVDRRYQALTLQVQAAVREAARQEGLLATARAELDGALAGESGGIFSGLEVGGYQVGPLLGRGGMGEVYEASQVGTGLRVAFKLMRADRVDPAGLKRLVREATALGLVDSPYVARIFDVGGIEQAVPYIAMEFIEGRSLASLLRERERLGLDEVRMLVRDVGRGLHDVHRAGVVHRDLKPQNVVLAQVGDAARWKIVDFGVAKLLDAGAATTQHVIVGTPQYMAPEQAIGDRVDARSDLYSLCLLIYRALTGSPALTAHAPVQAARAALVVGIPDPRSYLEIRDDVVLALRIGLATPREDRFATALELCAAFDGAFDGRLSPHHRQRALEILRREPWR